MRALAALAPLLVAAPAFAQERVGVRVGDHPDRGRIVFDWPSAPAYSVERQGDRVLLRFGPTGEVDLSGLRRPPRNVVAVERIEGGVAVSLRPGAGLRHFRNGPKVALDALDPPRRGERSAASPPEAERPPPRPQAGAAEPRPTNTAEATGARAVAPRPVAEASPVGAPSGREAPPSAPGELPSSAAARAQTGAPAAAPPPGAPSPPADAGGTPTVAARVAGPPAAPPVRASVVAPTAGRPAELRLPFGPEVAAAAVRRGDTLLLAFDAERSVDLGAVRASGGPFAGASVQPVAGGVVLALPAVAAELRRDAGDWVVALGARPPGEARSLAPTPAAELAHIPAAQPGRVLSWPDPESGLPLLLGTVAEAAQRQVVPRGFAAFELPETLLGAAVLARTDRVALRGAPGRFVLSVEGGTAVGAAAAQDPATMAAAMSRSFDFPPQPVPALLERLRAQQAAVAASPPLARGGPRFAAAETLVALGLPQEAQAMLRLAAQEDPLSVQDARHAALGAVAALLAGRGGDRAALAALQPATDEAVLWRAALDAVEGRPQRAAPGFAATLPLLLGYPEGLRRRLLPIAAEALAEGGHPAAARRLVAAAGEEGPLALALGIAEEAEGATERALSAYATAAAGRDRLARARAIRRATELRLASGQLDAAGAARALEQALYAWRDEGHEIALRRRVAELRQAAGDPRGALALLRETQALFPDQAASLRGATEDAFLAALAAESPLAAVALHDSHPDLLPPGPRGEAALAGLFERLLALDLPHRAALLLQRAMERAPPGPERASLGLRLAQHRISERDFGGALAALGSSGAPDLPGPLVASRAVAAARAEAGRGNRALAAEALAALGPAGDEALADILVEARDFAGAAAALRRHLGAALPPAPQPLTEEHQRAVLRQAAVLALAGDDAALAELRRQQRGRITHRPVAAAFEALTTDPARGLADLPRAMRELELFRAFPGSREPLRTAQAVAG